MINYGENLKFHRECAGLNQPELAKQLGISQANISRWESGAVLPNIEFCIKLADFYGITIDELLGITDDFGARIPAVPARAADVMGDTITREERTLIEKYRELNAPGKKLVRTVIDTQLATMDESKKNDIS